MPVATRWLDNLLTVESALLIVQGHEDIHWRFSEPGEIGIHGGPALWERIIRTPYCEPAPPNSIIGQNVPNFRTSDFRLSERANREIVELETLLYDMSMLQLPFRQPIEQIIPLLIFDEAQSAEMVDLQVGIDTFVTENIARFAVGDICLDNDWEWYLRELEVMGLQRYLQIQQTVLDERNVRLAAME